MAYSLPLTFPLGASFQSLSAPSEAVAASENESASVATTVRVYRAAPAVDGETATVVAYVLVHATAAAVEEETATAFGLTGAPTLSEEVNASEDESAAVADVHWKVYSRPTAVEDSRASITATVLVYSLAAAVDDESGEIDTGVTVYVPAIAAGEDETLAVVGTSSIPEDTLPYRVTLGVGRRRRVTLAVQE